MQIRNLPGSVAEMIAPKNRQSVNVKQAFSELNIEIIAYMKPLLNYFKIFNN